MQNLQAESSLANTTRGAVLAAYASWEERRLTQEAVRLPGVCARTFRRYVARYEEDGLDGLLDKRMNQVSARRVPTDEVPGTEMLYRARVLRWMERQAFLQIPGLRRKLKRAANLATKSDRCGHLIPPNRTAPT